MSHCTALTRRINNRRGKGEKRGKRKKAGGGSIIPPTYASLENFLKLHNNQIFSVSKVFKNNVSVSTLVMLADEV